MRFDGREVVLSRIISVVVIDGACAGVRTREEVRLRLH